jgi:hypothetical protein
MSKYQINGNWKSNNSNQNIIWNILELGFRTDQKIKQFPYLNDLFLFAGRNPQTKF